MRNFVLPMCVSCCVRGEVRPAVRASCVVMRAEGAGGFRHSRSNERGFDVETRIAGSRGLVRDVDGVVGVGSCGVLGLRERGATSIGESGW